MGSFEQSIGGTTFGQTHILQCSFFSNLRYQSYRHPLKRWASILQYLPIFFSREEHLYQDSRRLQNSFVLGPSPGDPVTGDEILHDLKDDKSDVKVYCTLIEQCIDCIDIKQPNNCSDELCFYPVGGKNYARLPVSSSCIETSGHPSSNIPEARLPTSFTEDSLGFCALEVTGTGQSS